MKNRMWQRNLSNVSRDMLMTLLVVKDDERKYCQKYYSCTGRLSMIELLKELNEEYDNYVIISINYF